MSLRKREVGTPEPEERQRTARLPPTGSVRSGPAEGCSTKRCRYLECKDPVPSKHFLIDVDYTPRLRSLTQAAQA